jgi:putative glutamine amidotransferase
MRWKEVERASLENEGEVPDHPRHAMSVASGSRLHQGLGVEQIEVDSFHHQAIDRLGAGLVATGLASDGVIEVIELADESQYVLGAQFELQEEWRVDERFLGIFHQFVTAASRSK